MTDPQNGFVENFHAKGLNKCPECGVMRRGQGVYTHLRKVHDIWGGRTGRVRNDPRYSRRGRKPNTNTPKTKRDALLPAVIDRPTQVMPPPLAGLRFPENLKVGLGEDGSMWICEQVRTPRDRS
jgi:hypothetical protein